MIGFAVTVGEVISTRVIPEGAIFYGFLAGFSLLAASMVLNDYFDRDIDAINEPDRPLPSGAVSPTQALSWSIVLASFGLYFAARTGLWTLIIALSSMVIMLLYNSKMKKYGVIGNVMVSVNVAIPFIYGGFATSNPTWALAIFSLLAFVSSLGREIVKGIVDIAGDQAKGVRSAAVTFGAMHAAKYAAVLFVSAVILSALPILLGLVSHFYMPLVLICDIGFLLTAYSIISDYSPKNAKRNKNFILVWMTFGLLAFVIGVI